MKSNIRTNDEHSVIKIWPSYVLLLSFIKHFTVSSLCFALNFWEQTFISFFDRTNMFWFLAPRGEGGIACYRGVPRADVGVHLPVSDPWPPNSPTIQGWKGATYYPSSPSLQHPGQVQWQHREGTIQFTLSCLRWLGRTTNFNTTMFTEKLWCWSRTKFTFCSCCVFFNWILPVKFTSRNIKPTKRIFSKGSSWPNCLRTSSSASRDSPRTTSL